MKYLLLIVLVAVIWWIWSKRSPRSSGRRAPVAPDPEKMVSCAHCGVYLPQSDSVADDGAHFCSEAHRQAAKSAGGA